MLGTAVAAAVALAICLVATGYAALFRVRILIPADVPLASPTLVLPATGPLPGIIVLLDALTAQTLKPRRLIVAVESREDPAFTRISELGPRYPGLRIELVVAGISDRRAQKCTNILAGLARLDAGDAFVVMLDADIRPQPWWLAASVGPLAAGRADIVNGYRWQSPHSVSLAAALGATIDRGIATQPRVDQFRLLWGGSLALTHDAVQRIDMNATLAYAATEDLVIADRAASLGLRMMTRHSLRLPTPLGGGLAALWRFGRRQYQLIHIYRPGVWGFALAVLSADVAARIALLGSACGGSLIALAALVLLAAFGSAATELRRSAGRLLRVADPPGFAALQHLLIWTTLPLSLFHASVIWGAAIRSPMRWAHVRYVIDRQGRVTAAFR